mmetsp:Transcript_36683/g.80202  ORF Transcript_36683/g.80202 Transcript_36683/m.80202 type:complete len:550 (-) Transcript_36683:41-1690(-)
MPSVRTRRLQSLTAWFLMGSGSSFRFGGGVIPTRFNLESLGGRFRAADPTVVSKKPASGEPAAAATKGIGSDGEAIGEKTSNGPRRLGGAEKPRDMPKRFPLRRLPIVGDDTSGTDDADSDTVSSSDFDMEYENDDEETTGKPDDHHDDETIISMVNGMVSDIQNLDDSQQVSGEIEVGGEEDAKGKGKRVTFFASKESTKILSLDDKYTKLLDEYMTLPLEQYSVKSFHDGDSDNVEGRRWFLRRLDEEESLQYTSNDYEPRDNHENFMRDGPSETDKASLQEDERGRFFRLAVPLKPLIGVELTPVIDLEVIPALKPQQNPVLLGEDDQKERQGISNLAPEQRTRRRPLRAMRRVFRRRRFDGGRSLDYDVNGDPGAVRVQSLRVSLLSADDEVKSLMNRREEKVPKPNANPTQVSRNPSVQQIGTEAIGVVGKIEQAITPHITFDAIITWDAGSTEARSGDSLKRKKRGKKGGPSVTVRSTAVTSLTIPPIPTAFRVPLPLPLGVLVRRIGTLLTKRALDITLPRFLRQLERDLERWAKGDGGNAR